jgi:predicted membrane protein
MEIRDRLFEWLTGLLFQNIGVQTSLVLVALVALLVPRERRSLSSVILAIGMVMFFGGHLVLRITLPGSHAA